MLTHNYIPILQTRLETLIDIYAPTPFLESMARTLTLLHCGSVVPSRDEAGLVLLVQTVVDWDFVCARRGHEFLEMRYGVCFGHAGGEQGVEFAFGVKEVIVRINEDDSCVSWHLEGKMNWFSGEYGEYSIAKSEAVGGFE